MYADVCALTFRCVTYDICAPSTMMTSTTLLTSYSTLTPTLGGHSSLSGEGHMPGLLSSSDLVPLNDKGDTNVRERNYYGAVTDGTGRRPR